MDSEEGVLSCWFYEGVVVFPGVAGGVVSQAPIRHLADLADAMTMCPGTGLLSQKIERGPGGLAHAAWASVPGAW